MFDLAKEKNINGIVEGLPSKYYYDSQIFEQEKEQIFYRSWNFIGHTIQLSQPGQYFTTKVADQNLAIVRGRDNVVRAFYNVCAHRGHELLEGEGQQKAIACPYHSWTYSMDGILQYAPYGDKIEKFNPSEICLKEIRLEEIGGLLFVNLDSQAKPLRDLVPTLEKELLTYIPNSRELHLSYHQEFTVRTNWKNLVENALEDYHTPFLHPGVKNNSKTETFEVIPKKLSLINTCKVKSNADGRYNLEGMEEFIWWWYWLWPNTQISTFPDRSMRIFRVQPESPTQSKWSFDFYLTNMKPNQQEMEHIENLIKTTLSEDIIAVEAVQRGQQSLGFQQPRLVIGQGKESWSEIGVYNFQKLVKESIE
jgi:choline monooxygenase